MDEYKTKRQPHTSLRCLSHDAFAQRKETNVWQESVEAISSVKGYRLYGTSSQHLTVTRNYAVIKKGNSITIQLILMYAKAEKQEPVREAQYRNSLETSSSDPESDKPIHKTYAPAEQWLRE